VSIAPSVDNMATTGSLTAAERRNHVGRVWEVMKSNSPVYNLILDNIGLINIEEGLITAQLIVEPIHVNSKGVLHGTVSACIVDWAGSMVVASYGREKTGLSTDLHITYVSGAKLGDVLEIVGKASRVGGSLAFTTVEVSKAGQKPDERLLIATGSHTKYVRLQ
jgi:acyl-coenzyme A thioesterase 13